MTHDVNLIERDGGGKWRLNSAGRELAADLSIFADPLRAQQSAILWAEVVEQIAAREQWRKAARRIVAQDPAGSAEPAPDERTTARGGNDTGRRGKQGKAPRQTQTAKPGKARQ